MMGGIGNAIDPDAGPYGLLAGGGLSSWAAACALRELGCDVRVFFAEVGQVDETLIPAFHADMERRRIPVHRIDLRDAAARLGLEIARFDLSYEGGYWNTTGALRLLLMRELGRHIAESGCRVFVHGSVSGGNDERRFGTYAAHFLPGLEVLSVWSHPRLRDMFPDRDAMVRYLLDGRHDPDLAAKAVTSSDGSMLGVSYEGCDLENLERPWSTDALRMTAHPKAAVPDPRELRLTIDRGELVRIDGRPVRPLEAMTELNRLAGEAGIGRLSVVENRTNGTKGRGVYEAPALTVLGWAYEQLALATLSASEAGLRHTLSRMLARHLYEGRYEERAARIARIALHEVTQGMSGSLTVSLYKGSLWADSMNFPESSTKRQRRFAGKGHLWQ